MNTKPWANSISTTTRAIELDSEKEAHTEDNIQTRFRSKRSSRQENTFAKCSTRECTPMHCNTAATLRWQRNAELSSRLRNILTNLVAPKILTRGRLSKQARPSIPVPGMALEERRRPEALDQHDERDCSTWPHAI
jgi:hypothetical protein